MADIKDISTTIAAALTEAGVTDTIDMAVTGEKAVLVGETATEAVEVTVTVKPIDAETLHDEREDEIIDKLGDLA